ncbi:MULTISPECIES: ROK family protein [Paenibacillus]|uniref:ROK family protein n=1 Tax=Paenibacillus violae TaxID=3077234 RepID=A0ABU3RE59_9BACL|nr:MULTISPECIES: ROK family protein [Paenibacillus]MDU0202329.1 ROK family protein [Paenibacillus sp. PFR10]MEC0266169.1 ROK family protein [Paenibacillus anseongense]
METILFDPHSDYAIGVDIGGTKMNAGVVSSSGEVLFTVSLPTLAGEVNTKDRVTQTIQSLLSEVEAIKPGCRYKGIGVGSAGQIDWSTGQVRSASELLPGYAGTPLKVLLQAQFQLPVTVDNDVNVLALTEKHLGAGKGVRHFLCVALGTGVGGAVVVDGHLVHGCWGAGGELGHLSVDWNGAPCLCGGRGCLEQYASGTNIASRMTEKLASLGEAPVAMDSREVFSRWQSGDRVAAEVMAETIAALGSALASLVHIFNPELIIIGGGVAEAGDDFLDAIRKEMAARTMPSMHDGVRIEKAYRGNWSGMIGAALQVWEYADPAISLD